jgi:hypothetical protein
MTLPELRAALAEIRPLTADDARLRDLFIARLDGWIIDEVTVERLLDDLNRILGNVWFSAPEVHTAVFQALEDFAKEVRGISGMTVNERLFTFGLLDAWDRATESTRKLFRSKLGAA